MSNGAPVLTDNLLCVGSKSLIHLICRFGVFPKVPAFFAGVMRHGADAAVIDEFQRESAPVNATRSRFASRIERLAVDAFLDRTMASGSHSWESLAAAP